MCLKCGIATYRDVGYKKNIKNVFFSEKKCQKCPNRLEPLVLLAKVWTLFVKIRPFWTQKSVQLPGVIPVRARLLKNKN